MTFLPVVERELRVSARRALTYWSRLSAAALALLIFGGLQVIAEISRGAFRAGQIQFSILKWLCFIFACATGLFFTADSLSEEKREGTLGLLFLTDLRGHDVVLGKLISHSFQAFYGLLAAFPILGLTLLVGGVTGAEFGRVLLVICNTVFFSLTVGLLVSSISRDVTKAMNGTLLIIVLFVLGLPLVDSALTGWGSRPFAAIFSMASPGYLFAETSGYLQADYWRCLAVQHALGWGFLAFSCFCAPRAWQEKSSRQNASGPSVAYQLRFGGKRARAAMRRRWLDRNPALWLVQRDRWLPRLVWTISVMGLLVLGWSIIYYQNARPLQAAYYLQRLLAWALTLWVASQASRFFVDAARNGTLELLLVTPISAANIVRAQWSALWKTFLIPVIFVVFMYLAGGISMVLEMKKAMAGVKVSGGFNMVHYQIANMVVGIVAFVAGQAAVAWFGMWMGLTTRKPAIAVFKTLCFVVALPWLVLIFVQGVSMGLISVSGGPIWLGTVLFGVLHLGKDFFFIAWSRGRMLARFRESVALGHAPVYRLPPLPAVASPPLISAAVPVSAATDKDEIPRS